MSLTCAGLPAGASCNFAPNPITSGSSATLTITTTAHSSAPPVAPANRQGPLSIYGVWVFLAALLALAASSSIKIRADRRLAFCVSGTFLVAFLIFQVGCGSGSGGGGGGGSPSATLNPTILGFGNLAVGQTSAAQVVTLTNSGNASLTISGVTIIGANPADFLQTNTCGSSVAAGSNCTISVTFKASAATAESAALSISDNALGSPHSAQFSGTGLATPTGTYSITITGQSGTNQHTTTVQFKVQ